MTPAQLARTKTEHAEQVAFFAYCKKAADYGFEFADEWSKHGDFMITSRNIPDIYCIPALEWIHAIHNQGHGDKIRGAKAKQEGVKKGVADIFIPYPMPAKPPEGDPALPAFYHGMYIEMKQLKHQPKRKGTKGGMSDEQIEFRDYVVPLGYYFKTCYGWLDAVAAMKAYVKGEV